MARRWVALGKAQEEMNELGVELMKLLTFPNGKHPGRKRSLILSTEDEIADVLNALEFFVDRNHLDWTRIRKRMATKRKRFIKWWGQPAKRKSQIAKIKSKAKTPNKRASSNDERKS